MKYQISNLQDLRKVIVHTKGLMFKTQDGFKEDYSDLNYTIYKVTGKPWYLETNALSYRIYLIKAKENSEEEFDLSQYSDYTQFFTSDLIEDMESFNVAFNQEIIDFLIQTNIVDRRSQVVKDFVAQELK